MSTAMLSLKLLNSSIDGAGDTPRGERPQRSARTRRLAASGTILAILCLSLPLSALAEPAWVRGGIRLNLRTEPGTKYRILGVIETGDGVDILSRGEDWTQVRTKDGEAGWIPEGYLQPEPPPSIRVESLDQENQELRRRLEIQTKELEELRTTHDALAAGSNTQRAEVEQLTMDNMRLRAGERYPYLITGAGILAVGILAGMILRASQTRRHATRIRL